MNKMFNVFDEYGDNVTTENDWFIDNCGRLYFLNDDALLCKAPDNYRYSIVMGRNVTLYSRYNADGSDYED